MAISTAAGQLWQAPFTILSATGQSSNNAGGTTSIVGDWYRLHPGVQRLAFQATLVTASAGATAGTTVFIEVSNDAVRPVATKAQTIALTATTDTVTDGAAGFATSMAGQWAYFRANLNSLTTSTAGTTGLGPTVNVIANAGFAPWL